MSTGTNYCVRCEREFIGDVTCCCDDGTNDDGTHDNGFCMYCCPRETNRHRTPASGYYERMDCDQ